MRRTERLPVVKHGIPGPSHNEARVSYPLAAFATRITSHYRAGAKRLKRAGLGLVNRKEADPLHVGKDVRVGVEGDKHKARKHTTGLAPKEAG